MSQHNPTPGERARLRREWLASLRAGDRVGIAEFNGVPRETWLTGAVTTVLDTWIGVRVGGRVVRYRREDGRLDIDGGLTAMNERLERLDEEAKEPAPVPGKDPVEEARALLAEARAPATTDGDDLLQRLRFADVAPRLLGALVEEVTKARQEAASARALLVEAHEALAWEARTDSSKADLVGRIADLFGVSR
jgi:hypothetical protein